MCGVTHYATAVGSHFEKIRMQDYLVYICALTSLFRMNTDKCTHTGCFTTWRHYCRRWFPRSLWSKKFT